ncbi:MAG: hypothetical protein AAF828_10920 [Bacteroidota bacterium]
MRNDKPYNNEELSPLLRKLQGKGDGFSVPSTDYYSELADQIIQQAQSENEAVGGLQSSNSQNNSQPQTSAKLRRLYPSILAVAAAILLLVWLKPWAENSASDIAAPPTMAENNSWVDHLDQLSEEDILAYIDDNITDFELETLTDE